MTGAKREWLGTSVPVEYAHQVRTSALAAGESIASYIRLALDAAMSNPHRRSSLVACAMHAELGRLHVRLSALPTGVIDDAAVADLADHLSKLEALMHSLTELVHREVDL